MRFAQIVASAAVLAPALAQVTSTSDPTDDGSDTITIFGEGDPNPADGGDGQIVSITGEQDPTTTDGGDVISILDEQDPTSTTSTDGGDGGVISIFNEQDPTSTTSTDGGDGGVISIFNEQDPTSTTTTDDGSGIISIFDEGDPGTTTTTTDTTTTTTSTSTSDGGDIISIFNEGDPTSTVTQTSSDSVTATQTTSTLITPMTPTPTISTPAQTPIPITTVVADFVTEITVLNKDYIFYCPEPTVYVNKNVSYTATEATWLTITNCPCVVPVTKPAFAAQTSFSIYADLPNNASFTSIIIPGASGTLTADVAIPSENQLTFDETEIIVGTKVVTDMKFIEDTTVVTEVIEGSQGVEGIEAVATAAVESTSYSASETAAVAGASQLNAGLFALLIPAVIALML